MKKFPPDQEHFSNSMLIKAGSEFDRNCVVCDGAMSKAGTTLVYAILEHARSAGSFSVKSVDKFWRTFDSHLCMGCRSKLRRRQEALNFAEHLLREALKLDPTNEHARKNLQALT